MHDHQKSGNNNEDSLSNRTVEKDIEFSDFKKKEKYNEREENRIRIRKIRENQTHEQKLHERKKLKERMKLVRARKSEEQILQDNEEARDRMRKVWKKKKEEDIDFENYVKKQREFRRNLFGKEHFLANLKAKKGMREL